MILYKSFARNAVTHFLVSLKSAYIFARTENLWKFLHTGLRCWSLCTSSMSTKFTVSLICVYAGKIAAAARWLAHLSSSSAMSSSRAWVNNRML